MSKDRRLANTGRRLALGLAAAAFLGLGGPWGASAAGAPGSAAAPVFTPAELVGTLHRLNQMEIEAGQMAQRRGRTEAMKHYGATLQHDHATADEHLKAYARAHHLDLDTAPPLGIGTELSQARHELDNLQDLGGASFDREFAELMVQDHDKAIQMVDHASKQVTDPRLKAMLGEVEPNLREHKQIAQNLLFQDDASAAAAPSSPHKTSH